MARKKRPQRIYNEAVVWRPWHALLLTGHIWWAEGLVFWFNAKEINTATTTSLLISTALLTLGFGLFIRTYRMFNNEPERLVRDVLFMLSTGISLIAYNTPIFRLLVTLMGIGFPILIWYKANKAYNHKDS